MPAPPPFPEWSWWDAFLHALAGVYLVLFVHFWFRFRALERRAASGEAGAEGRFNRSLRGFPNMVFAKMLGKRPLEAGARTPRRGPGHR